MSWLIALGVVVLLAVLPLGVDVKYDEDGIFVKIIAWKLAILLYPRPKKEKKVGKSKKETRQEESAAPEEPLPQPPQKPEQEPVKKEKQGGSLLDFLPFVKLAFRFLGDFRRKLRLEILEVKLTMAGEDPYDLAVNYGRTWAAIGNLVPQLERFFVIQKRDIQVQCDFTGTKTLILAHLRMTITLGRMLSLVVVYIARAVMEYLNYNKKRKGGAEA